jgi:acylphosphatase
MVEIKKIHKNITIKGRVQGVGFRYSAKKMAQSLGVSGYVRNLSNGDVYIEAEGSEIQLKFLTDWCYSGPSYSYVDSVEIEDAEVKNFEFFDIRH